MNKDLYESQTQYTFDMKAKCENYARANASCDKGQVVLAGDSLVELLDSDTLLQDYVKTTGIKIYNRGICGDSTNRLLERFQDTVLNLEPSTLVLLIGTNDIARGASAQFTLENIIKLITLAKENGVKRLIVQCLYPVNNDIYSNPAHLRNPKDIQHINSGILSNARKLDYEVLNLRNLLSDEQGKLKKELTSDGLHPNEKGFKMIAKEIEKGLGL